jgi:nitric oxide dioxygenase
LPLPCDFLIPSHSDRSFTCWTQAQRAIITATVPILEQGGETLTRHFYQNLFRDHPEVLPYFNQHQHSGEQQRALANGVLMYARHIDRLEALGELVSTIVHKHVALQIRAEHYPLVGASLLQAIREVLGAEWPAMP